MTGEKLLDAFEFLDSKYIEESNIEDTIIEGKTNQKHRFRSKKPFLILVAVFVFAFSMMAMAAQENQWDIAILNYMGLSHVDTTQLADGMVTIRAKDTQMVKNEKTGKTEKITFTAESSIGDRRNAYIRIMTNIKMPKNYNPKTDYLICSNWTTDIRNKPQGMPTMYGGMLESFVENGYFGMIMSLSDVKNLNKSYVETNLGGDIYLYHDLGMEEGGKPKELLYKGEWKLNWKYSYKAEQRTVKVSKAINVDEFFCKIKNVVITPLEVKVIIDAPYKAKDMEFGDIIITSVTLKDGKEITLSQKGGGGGMSTGRRWFFPFPSCHMTVYESFERYDVVVNPYDVTAITVNGEKIKLK